MIEYVSPGKRSGMTRTKAARIFLREGGRCHICGLLVRPGEPYEIEHPTAIADGGSDDESALRVAHVKCHALKTRREATQRAKRDRVVTASWAGKKKSKLSREYRRSVIQHIQDRNTRNGGQSE